MNPSDSGPWWRHGMMWLVIGGPAVVVVAAIATAVVAVRGADPVIDPVIDSAHATGRLHDAGAPAMKARNHAVTPKAP